MKHKIRDVQCVWLIVHEPRSTKDDPTKLRFKAALKIIPGSVQAQQLEADFLKVCEAKWPGKGAAVLEYLRAKERVSFAHKPPISKKNLQPHRGWENAWILNANSYVAQPQNVVMRDPITGQPSEDYKRLLAENIEKARPILLDRDLAPLNRAAAEWKQSMIAAGAAPVGSDAIRPGAGRIIYSGARYDVHVSTYAIDSNERGQRVSSQLISLHKIADGPNLEGEQLSMDDYENYSAELTEMNATENPLATQSLNPFDTPTANPFTSPASAPVSPFKGLF